MLQLDEHGWTKNTWEELNKIVIAELNRVRLLKKTLDYRESLPPAGQQDQVTNDVIEFPDLTIKEANTKPLVTISREFILKESQIKTDATRAEAKDRDSVKLARMAAKALALAEDQIIFQGAKQYPNFSGGVTTDPDNEEDFKNAIEMGLLGEARPTPQKDGNKKDGNKKDGNKKDGNNNDDRFDDKNHFKRSEPVLVQRSKKEGILYGKNTFSAVVKGIRKLIDKGQAQPYTLFLPIDVYADAFTGENVITADYIKPLVEEELHGTGALQEEGLLVAEGGDPTTIYYGELPSVQCFKQDGSKYYFRVVERIQYVARDPRAFVLLRFETEEEAKKRWKEESGQKESGEGILKSTLGSK